MDQFVLLLLVGIGGAIGAMLRFGVSLAAGRWLDPRSFPMGTLIVNWIGCCAIGWLAAAVFQKTGHPAASERVRLFVVTGVLGGFTTFSAFSIETATLLAERRPGAATAYILLSTAGGILLAIAGLRLGK